jgi:hypothetical protein
VLLSAGWLGGGIYWIMVALTLVLGLRHALKATETRTLFLVVFATFAATAFEGVIVDTDHWRHFYLLMAMVWGMMAASPHTVPAIERRTPRLVQPQRRAAVSHRRPSLIGPAPHPA